MPGPDRHAIEICPVRTRRQWKNFHALPARIQSGLPGWIRPLALQARQTWAPRHPWFRHGRAQAWLARRGGVVVGRISAQVDSLVAGQGRAGVGHFGQLEALDDQQVFDALFAAAGEWLAAQGMDVIEGPYDLSINQQCGLLVDGFEHAPMMMMNYNPPWYVDRVEAAGFEGVADMLVYRGTPDYRLPRSAERLLARVAGRLEIRPVSRVSLRSNAELMRRIFNEAWAGNWGFVPFTEAEFAHMAGEMKLLVRPGWVHTAWLDGEPVGFIVSLPDLNELVADLDGRLWPTGALKLLWRIARKKGSRARVPLMGVVPAWQQSMTGAAISYALIEAIKHTHVADGIEVTEESWILEQNHGMRSIVESLGFREVQRLRIYRREIDA